MENRSHDTIQDTRIELDAGDGVVARERTLYDDQESLNLAQKNASDLEKTLPYVQDMRTLEDVAKWREDDQRTVFGVWKDDVLVGEVNVGIINDKTREVSYWSDKDHRRQGNMTRAVAAITQKYTSEGYAMEAEVSNKTSDHLVERLGYTALEFDPATFNGQFAYRIEPQKQRR